MDAPPIKKKQDQKEKLRRRELVIKKGEKTDNLESLKGGNLAIYQRWRKLLNEN